MPKAKKPKYSGILAQPLVWQTPGNGLLSSSEAECQKRNSSALAERFVALYRHYGIDHRESGAGATLALALAREHVPGFQVLSAPPRGRGAPSKWKGAQDWDLYADVRFLVRNGGHSAANACRLLTKRPPYRGKNDGTLLRRYHKVKSKGLSSKGRPISAEEADDFVLKHFGSSAKKKC